jgi:hypothetical protein
MTLGQLHYVIQAAMGWEDCHLHEFEMPGRRYGPRRFPDDGWDTPPKDETRAKLSKVAPAGTHFGYRYDFGDDWFHDVHVEKIERIAAGGPGTRGPVCLSGRRAGPPEDCGGIWGYEHLLAVLADPGHDEHDDMVEWVGGHHDTERFDLDQVNAQLGPMARPADAERRRPRLAAHGA